MDGILCNEHQAAAVADRAGERILACLGIPDGILALLLNGCTYFPFTEASMGAK